MDNTLLHGGGTMEGVPDGLSRSLAIDRRIAQAKAKLGAVQRAKLLAARAGTPDAWKDFIGSGR